MEAITDKVGRPLIPVIKKKKVGDKFKFRPMSKRVLIKRISDEMVTPSGIIIPADSAGAKVPRAEIIRCADDCELKFKKGDIVYFEPASISAIYHPDYIEHQEEYFVTHELNIMGVIE